MACGDALGRPVELNSETKISAQYGRLLDMEEHGTWNQPAGTVTEVAEAAQPAAIRDTEASP